jgi:hypothetical protein
MNVIEAITDPAIIGDTLSIAQCCLLRALYGLPLDDEQIEIFRMATGLDDYAPREFREATLICGRRSGKSSRIGANVAIYEACFREHHFANGEQGHVILIAATKRQASIAYSYIVGRLENSPVLSRMLVGAPLRDEVALSNGVTIGVHVCNFRSIRGLSIVAAIADEVAFWQDDTSGSNPAAEILRAVRPGMANFPTAKLLKISSPFAKVGVVWEDYKNRAEHPEMLVWRLGTRLMNPTLDPAFLDAEEARDPESFAREYNAQFFESASTFLSADAIEACVVRGRYELPRKAANSYVAALDAAFRGDFFAFTIVHGDGDKVVQDFVRSWRGSKSHPVNLSEVLAEIVGTLRNYGTSKIFGDQFASEPIRQALAAQGVQFEQAVTLGSRAVALWNSLRTLIASTKIELLDDETTIAELKKLELVVTSGGNQRVEASQGHDDRAVVLALASHQSVANPAREPWVEVLDTRGPSSGFPDTGPERWWTRVN